MSQTKSGLIVPSKRSNIDSFIAMDIVSKAAKLTAAGEDVISLAVGQPCASAPKAALTAAANALKDGVISYTNAPGIDGLRQRIALHYRETYDVEVDPARIYVTTGSSAGFVLSFLSMFEAGARIAIPSPGYPAYRNIIKSLSMVPVEIETSHDSRWTLNAQLLEAAHKKNKIDGLLFANPNNPNGTMLQRDGFATLLHKAQELGIRFISDEIYHGLTYDFDAASALEYGDDVIVINSFSKYFCMTGWRIGWMIVPESLMRTIDKLQQNLFICAPQISQIAAAAAFEGKAEMELVHRGYKTNRKLLLQRLPKLGITNIQPIDGAFYAYGDISQLSDNSVDFASKILEHTKVAVTPGVDFDLSRGKSWMRFCFAANHQRLVEAFDRLDKWLGIEQN
ncbi:MAG: aminotransferase class I/II-fold pyridoxal phosphate-dependent enzyme [Rhizobiaceae bacterium]|nr:aminotransferase class I/II-fold pyridoxal phosphate-dependent enzyme [Rhizobiaceae bacterium]